MVNKTIGITLILGILLITICGQINAVIFTQTEDVVDTSNYISDSFWGRLASTLQFYMIKQGTFTVYGDELGCEKYPSHTQKWVNTVTPLGRTMTITLEPGDAMFINWFRGSPTDGVYADHPGESRQFMEEVWLEYGKTPDNKYKITCDAEGYWNYECYVEQYLCDQPCYSNSDCPSGQYCEKTIISQKIPGAGVCKTSNPTHKTKVYRCENGVKTSLGEVSYGNTNFCNNPIDSKYLIGSTDQCLSTQPTICSEVPITVCTDYETKCESNIYYTCSDNSWVSQGQTAGKCGCPLVGSCNGGTNGTGQIGEVCSIDSDCASLYCDKNHWYSTATRCQQTPWDKIKKIAFTREEVNTMTVANMLEIACTTNSECISPDKEKYTSKCISLSSLREDGTINLNEKDFWDYANGAVYGTALGVLGGGALGCVVGGVAVVALLPTGMGEAVGLSIFSATCVGGAAVGGYEGLKMGIAADKKSDIAKAIKAEDDSTVGLCIAEEKNDFLEFFKWAAFFDVTGDGKKTGVDGLIIVFAVFVLIAFMFGGKK